MATRPFSFTASVTPVALGAALAAWDGKFNLLIFGLVLVGSVAIHAGTNLINDYYDWRKGTDTAESLGPNRPLKEKLVTPRQVLIAGLLCFALGGGIGLYLVAARGGLFILVIGVLSVLAGYFYTAGPAAFAYIGLGEVIVFIFMGPIMVVGSYFMLAQEVPLRVVLLAMPIGMLVAAILHANNMRDHDMDRAKGKRTLSNILGRRGSKIEYVFWLGRFRGDAGPGAAAHGAGARIADVAGGASGLEAHQARDWQRGPEGPEWTGPRLGQPARPLWLAYDPGRRARGAGVTLEGYVLGRTHR
ncbi:MAG: 1,4-dihydroxy-2-naphthoate octaprenyltransferase [Anaerolineae bacterium]|nr:1,4-dihydroxy-2-naphthoate octaprenyltransferase [Anaerolineae bacterium]